MRLHLARNQSGFTLVEMMISVGLTGFLSLLAGMMMLWVSSSYFEIMNRSSAMESLMGATFQMMQALGTAVRPIEATVPIEGRTITLTGVSAGEILQATQNTMNGNPGGITTFATFLRDMGGKTDNLSTRYWGTGVFYQRPSPTRSGVLFIVNRPVDGNGQNLVPTYADQYFDRIVEFGLGSFERSGSGAITSVEMRITIRYFRGTPHPDRMIWCPHQDVVNAVVGCELTGKASYHDVTQMIRIPVLNQFLGNSINRGVASERVFGSLYFFPFEVR